MIVLAFTKSSNYRNGLLDTRSCITRQLVIFLSPTIIFYHFVNIIFVIFFTIIGIPLLLRLLSDLIERDRSRTKGCRKIASALHHAKYYSVSSVGKEKARYTM